ncbi:hypothetical protein ACSS6W_009643 [Trichoderma asperelloides]|uniref:Transcription factor Sp2 n=1 Tax=Trichoderma asperellum TaxID=101201 RepID=A0A6V8R4H6_TRIAP|nr:hypothetical protein LI328DRAFT_130005 [Trichoderma asperelloides]GFP59779.1 transcription factor Sp2 [Trichoderma asperellum]
MPSLADQSFSMFPQQQQEEYSHFTEATHGPVFSSATMDMGIPADAFVSYVQRAPSQEHYSTSPSTISFEYTTDPASTSAYMMSNGPTSPGVYGDDYLSSLSTGSASSSAVGSPLSNHGQAGMDWTVQGGLNIQPSIAGEYLDYSAFHGLEDVAAYDFNPMASAKSYVDPSLIHPEISRPPMAISPFETHYQPAVHYPSSPSAISAPSPQPHMIRTSSSSPYLQSGSFQPGFATSPYAASTANSMANGAGVGARRLSMSKTGGSNNFISAGSADYHSGDETKEKQRCTYPECGKTFKDLKAHMLTHQTERPEKCPITTCEYHIKGFARKYDKNRHTLTHYKGNMVCGFCPGSGSASEKSFNRADVFKRHLTSVHNVEQTPPNSRKRTGGAPMTLAGYAADATGKCSTCSQTFNNAQDFYEHLDDCVLRMVQQEDPAEAINAKRLAEVADDKNVHQTLEKNKLPITTQTTQTEESEDDDEMMDDEEDDMANMTTYSPSKKNASLNRISKSRGVTHSRGGVPLSAKRSRNKRRDYPSSWGFNKGQMTMKKRVMAVFDGPRRLAKDDMMLSTDHEVRIKLSDGKSYVTDLDVQTLKRAEGFHNASDAEKGPWISDDPTEEQLKEMQETQRMLDTGASDL